MSESQGYIDAQRDSPDKNQVTCRTCRATVYRGATKEHDAWHERLMEQQRSIAVEEVVKAFDAQS